MQFMAKSLSVKQSRRVITCKDTFHMNHKFCCTDHSLPSKRFKIKCSTKYNYFCIISIFTALWASRKCLIFTIREHTLEALISSSARHSAMLLMLRNEASLAPVQSNQMAWLTRRKGDTSTAWRRTVPARPMRVESSLGPLFIIAFTRI